MPAAALFPRFLKLSSRREWSDVGPSPPKKLNEAFSDAFRAHVRDTAKNGYFYHFCRGLHLQGSFVDHTTLSLTSLVTLGVAAVYPVQRCPSQRTRSLSWKTSKRQRTRRIHRGNQQILPLPIRIPQPILTNEARFSSARTTRCCEWHTPESILGYPGIRTPPVWAVSCSLDQYPTCRSSSCPRVGIFRQPIDNSAASNGHSACAHTRTRTHTSTNTHARAHHIPACNRESPFI
jgi:hypothetical protein